MALKIVCDYEKCTATEGIDSVGTPLNLPDGWILVIGEGEEMHFHSWLCLREQSKEWTEEEIAEAAAVGSERPSGGDRV